MSIRLEKILLAMAVVCASATLLLHMINNTYFATGIFYWRKPVYVFEGRQWKNSSQKTQTSTLPSNTSYMHDETYLVIKNASIHKVSLDSRKSNNVVNIYEANASNIDSRYACQRKNNIGFFKMHKCSSSTVQNILMRYSIRYDLDVVLPPSGNYLGQTFFNKRFVMPLPVHEYNILCHHTRFSKEGFDSVLPKNSVYVTIIRDPVTMYESIYTYFRYHNMYGVPLATFLENPNHYYQNNSGKDHAKDSMLYDLGLENDLKTDVVALDKKVQSIASEFDLVMMTEYFSESLILLKELMCWDFKDIAFFRMNVRSPSSVKTVTDKAAERIRQWNDGDTKLYNYFNRTFWEKVRDFGRERMRGEVAQLEEMNQMMKNRCIDKVVINDKQVWHPSGINVQSFKLKQSAANDTDCKFMIMTEHPLTNYVRQRQRAKYNRQ